MRYVTSQAPFLESNRILGVIIGTLPHNHSGALRRSNAQVILERATFKVNIFENSSVRFPKEAQTSSFPLLRVLEVDIVRICSLPGTETAWHDVFPRALTFDRRDYGSRVPEGEGKGNGHIIRTALCPKHVNEKRARTMSLHN